MEVLSGVAAIAPMWLTWSIIVGIAAYWYLTSTHNYWKRAGVPYVPAIPILGSMTPVFYIPLHDLELQRYKEKGRIYGWKNGIKDRVGIHISDASRRAQYHGNCRNFIMATTTLHMYEGRTPVLTIGDPDVLRNVLVKDFQFFTTRRVFSTGDILTNRMVQNLNGEDWKRVRAIISPAFSTGKMRRMTSVFIDSAKTLFSNFKVAAEQGEPVDVKRSILNDNALYIFLIHCLTAKMPHHEGMFEMRHNSTQLDTQIEKLFGTYTMDVIASSAFGTKIDSHNDPENPFVSAARNLFSASISWRIVLFFLFPEIAKFLRINVLSPRCLKFFKEVTLKILEERKRTGQKRNDFLQLLMDSTKEDEEKQMESVPVEKDATDEMGHEEANDQVFKSYHNSKYISNEELISQCIIFFLAGYDTTASALSFTVYELALNPDIQDRLVAEIDEVLEQKGGLTYDAVCSMKYLNNVFSETLRKHPSSIRAERVTDGDYEVKGHNVTVPKGMLVGIPIYAIHHDPEHYPDPEKYDPERFNSEQKSTRHPYAYLPFGAGPRNCIGMRFAILEAKVCLAYILSRCRFSTCCQTQVPPKFYIGQGLMQPKQVMLQVELRKDAKEL